MQFIQHNANFFSVLELLFSSRLHGPYILRTVPNKKRTDSFKGTRGPIELQWPHLSRQKDTLQHTQ